MALLPETIGVHHGGSQLWMGPSAAQETEVGIVRNICPSVWKPEKRVAGRVRGWLHELHVCATPAACILGLAAWFNSRPSHRKADCASAV